jgi:hypothetical protein
MRAIAALLNNEKIQRMLSSVSDPAAAFYRPS